MPSEVELERMVIRLVGDGSSYQKMVTTAVRSTEQAAKTMEKHAKEAEVFGKTIDDLGTHMSNFAGQMRAMAALQSPFGFVKDGVKLAASTETMETAFGTYLQDLEKGRDLMKDLVKFGAETPLNIGNITPVAKELLSARVTAEEIIPTMRMLGDAVNGNANNLAHLGRAYAQVRMQNRLLGNDVFQFTNAGVGIMDLLSRSTGKNVNELVEMREKGGITFKMVEEALQKATSAGGQYFEGMKNGSKTTEGLWSTMQDDIDGAKRSVGGATIEALHLKDAMKEVSSAAQNFTTWFGQVDQTTKDVIATTALLVGSIGSLVVVWKVGAITTGIVVGVVKDIIISTKWAAGSFWNLATATEFSHKVNVQTSASVRLLAMDEEASAIAAQNAANMQAYLAAQSAKTAAAQQMAATAAIEQANANALLLGPVSAATTATTLQAEANAFAAAQSVKGLALTKEITRVNWAAVASHVALRGAIVGVGVYAMAELIAWLSGGNKAMVDYSAEVQRSIMLNEALAKRIASTREEVLTSIKAIENPTLRKNRSAEELAKAQEEATSLRNQLDEANNRLNHAKAPLPGSAYSVHGVANAFRHLWVETLPSVIQWETEQDFIITQIKEIEERYKAAKGQVEAIQKEIGKANAEVDVPKAYTEMKDKLSEETRALRLNKEEIADWKMVQAGVPPALREDIQQHMKRNQQLKESVEHTKHLTEETGKLVHTLEDEIGALTEMSHAEREIKKLERELNDPKTKEGKKDEIRRQIDNARGLDVIKKHVEDQKRTMEDGKRVTEQYSDPQLKFAQRIAELNRLLNAGAIDQFTYEKALEDASKGLVSMGTAAKQTKDEIVALNNAVRYGSGEANARIAAFKDLVGPTNRPYKMDVSARRQTVAWDDKGYALGEQFGDVGLNTKPGGMPGGTDPFLVQAGNARFKQNQFGVDAGIHAGGASSLLLNVLQQLNDKLQREGDQGVVKIQPADLS